MARSALPAVAVDHVGIAVSTPAGFPLTHALGGGALEGCEMRSGVIVARFGPGNALELVWPGHAGTPIERFLERHGPGLHHVALRIDEPLTGIVRSLGERGIEAVGAVEESSDGRPSLFLHPSTTGGVLVELVEGPRP